MILHILLYAYGSRSLAFFPQAGSVCVIRSPNAGTVQRRQSVFVLGNMFGDWPCLMLLFYLLKLNHGILEHKKRFPQTVQVHR